VQVPLKSSASLLILPIYFAITILIGWWARRGSWNSRAYLNASQSLSLPIVTAAYLAANCGALEIVGLSAMAAQYGVQAFHFYWIGAIPAMIFLAIGMMPVYRRSGVASVPEYLEFRYGPGLRLMNACVAGITMLLLGGISLYAIAQVLNAILGMTFAYSVAISAGVVLIYVLLGGVRATIYNEVFQLGVMVAGILPLAILATRLHGKAIFTQPGARGHLWTNLPAASRIAPFDLIGIVFGLGFVLSFGYWCTDFVQMQRAFAVKTELEARQVPLWAGFGKLAFSLIVVLPGLAAYRLIPELGHTRRFDQALPALMVSLYGPLMLGLGLTALAASLMSGLAANVSAFAAIFTEDIYRARLRRTKSNAHYLMVGRLSAVAAILASASASYINFFFSSLMEHVQLIFSIVGAPFWAIFLLGMATRKTNERGAIAGFLSGSAIGLLHLLAVSMGWLNFGTRMSANFHGAIYAFCIAIAVGWLASSGATTSLAREASGTIFSWRSIRRKDRDILLWALATLLLIVCVALNFIWR
jgi:SSS family solute:Na+ symporter